MLLETALAAVLITPACSWDTPGVNKYSGDVAAAVHHYLDIPLTTRNKLQKRLEKHQYDEIADITSESIRGKNDYYDLRDMHFGKNTVCRTVTRSKWQKETVHRGLVYCEDEFCLIVPTVCNNISRVTRKKTETAAPPSTAHDAPTAPGGHAETPRILPPVIVKDPTFETIVNESVLPPPIILEHPPQWFPIYLPPPSIGPGPCCYIPHVPHVPPPIPEPSTMLLMAIGILAILGHIKSKV